MAYELGCMDKFNYLEVEEEMLHSIMKVKSEAANRNALFNFSEQRNSHAFSSPKLGSL